jgi:uncharacterized protein (DUF433 family)
VDATGIERGTHPVQDEVLAGIYEGSIRAVSDGRWEVAESLDWKWVECETREEAIGKLRREFGLDAAPAGMDTPKANKMIHPRWSERLVFDFDVSEDSPVVRGTWCTVKHIISLIMDGWTWSDVLHTHPELTTDDIRTCLSYAVAEEKGDTRDAEPSSEKGSG